MTEDVNESVVETDEKTEKRKQKDKDGDKAIVIHPTGEDRAKLIKDIKFADVDQRALAIRSKELKTKQAVELVAFGAGMNTAAVATRLEKRGLAFCGLMHLLLLRKQASKSAEKDPVLAAINWHRWIVAAADEIDDSLKADPDDPNQIDCPLILNPYTTQIGSGLYLALHNIELEWPAGTQFLVRKK